MTGLERMIAKVCNTVDANRRRRDEAETIEHLTDSEALYLSHQEAIEAAERDFQRTRRDWDRVRLHSMRSIDPGCE